MIYGRLIAWRHNNFLYPQTLVQPESTDDVSDIIRVLATKECVFAVRSCGHTPNAGANNIDHGIVIDLISGLQAT